MLPKLCSIGHSVEGQARSGTGDDIHRRVTKRSSIVQLPTEGVGSAAYVKRFCRQPPRIPIYRRLSTPTGSWVQYSLDRVSGTISTAREVMVVPSISVHCRRLVRHQHRGSAVKGIHGTTNVILR